MKKNIDDLKEQLKENKIREVEILAKDVIGEIITMIFMTIVSALLAAQGSTLAIICCVIAMIDNFIRAYNVILSIKMYRTFIDLRHNCESIIELLEKIDGNHRNEN